MKMSAEILLFSFYFAFVILWLFDVVFHWVLYCTNQYDIILDHYSEQ